MDKDIAIKWATALRSNRYKQGYANLYNTKNDTYCCLGVLCKVQNIPIFQDQQQPAYDALQKLGIDTVSFWHLNDIYRRSFSEIADKIEDLYIKGDPSE